MLGRLRGATWGLVVLAVAAFVVVRLFSLSQGNAGVRASATPQAIPATPGPVPPAGGIAFGAEPPGSCHDGPAPTAAASADTLWWVAAFVAAQAAGVEVEWVLVRDGRLVERGRVVAAATGDCVAAAAPLRPGDPGEYELVVWDLDHRTRLASGRFDVLPETRATPTPRLTPTPAPATPVPAYTSEPGPPGTQVIFSSSPLADCSTASVNGHVAGAEVYWAASLSSPLPAGSEVVWVSYYEGADFASGRRPASATGAASDCVIGPAVRNVVPGTYRIIVWDSRIETELARGTFKVR